MAAEKSNRILNVGCGNDTYGTDFVDLYPERPEVKRCDIDKEVLPYPSSTFDMVYSKSNFEHLTNPSNFLTEAYRVLKHGGKIKIITDNAGYFGFFGLVHLGFPSPPNEMRHGKDDRHYMLFTPSHLHNWLDKFGFVDIKVRYEILDKTAPNQIVMGAINKKFKQLLIAEGIKP